MGLLELCSLFVAKISCSCLCLFDTIIELHPINENYS